MYSTLVNSQLKKYKKQTKRVMSGNNNDTKEVDSGEFIYRAPQSEIFQGERQQRKLTLLRKIRNGWVAGVAYATLNFIMLLINGFQLNSISNYIQCFEILLIYLLSYGVYKNNRYCAAVLLVFFVVSELIAIATSDKITGVGLIFIFTYFYFHAAIASFKYHNMKVKMEVDD